jgi:hypothetical protein
VFIHFGLYHFRPRKVAFRNDYCLVCNKPRRAYLVRTLDVAHLFWVPLLPLGFRKRWVCSGCGLGIAASVKARRGFLFFLQALMVLGTAAVWVAPLQQESPEDQKWFWFFRVIFPVGTGLVIFAVHRNRRDPVYQQVMRNGVSPATDPQCPLDGNPLICTSTWRCPKCGIERL